MKYRTSVWFIFFGLLLLSCVTYSPLKKDQPNDIASIQLAEAANSVSRSLIELAKIEQSVLPPDKELINSAPLNLRGTVSVNWPGGPIEPLLQNLVKRMQFKLRILGARPQIPLMVTVSTKNAPLGNMLRDLDYQCGHRARISVLPKERVVELSYARL